MTTEQDQPQPPSQQQPAAGQSQGQGHHHRHRRRRGFGGRGQRQNRPAQAGESASAKQPSRHKQGQNRFRGNNQNNHGNGDSYGGGRGPKNHRRNKRRQAPFVGPMDHSYRTVNGNLADSPPSTIGVYGNGNGNGNGNGQGSYFSEDAIQPPPPISEDAPVRIICFIEDLFFLAKIQETARKLGVRVRFAKAEKNTVSDLAKLPEDERPSLIVFDLNNVSAKPLTLIPRLKAKLKRGTSVIGFLSHLQSDLKAKAIEAGCDMVMPRSAFSQNLPSLLRRHGLVEELEAAEA